MMTNSFLRKILSPRAYLPLAALAFLATIPLITSNSYIVNLLTVVLLFAMLAEAWNILGGLAGQFSIGHAAFFGLGAYTSTLLFISWKISPWIGMFIGAGVSIVFGLGMGLLCFRLRGPFFTFITIGFAEVLRLIFLNVPSLTRGPEGILIPFSGDSWVSLQFLSKVPFYYVILILALSTALVTLAIKNSRTGLCFMAIREDENAAQSLGIDTRNYKLLALTISVFFTALAGTFYAQYILYIDPGSVMSVNLSIEMTIPAVVGGMGTVLGPIMGAFVLRPIAEVTRAVLGGGYTGLYLLVYGAILILTILFMPEGIAEKIAKTYESFTNRLPGGKER